MATTKTTELLVPYMTPTDTYAVSTILPSLGIIFVLLRFYTRVQQKWSIGVDDWMMLPALVCLFCSYNLNAILIADYNVGYNHRHGNNTYYRLVRKWRQKAPR